MTLISKNGLLLALVLQLSAGEVFAGEASGAYLAGRQARMDANFAAAAQYYTRALTRDTSNPALLEATVLSFLSLGKMDRALPVAKKMESDGLESQISQMVLLVNEVGRDDFDAALTRIKDGRGIGPLVDGLIGAWAHLGSGAMSDAVAAFDKVADTSGQRGFGLYHKALAYALVGDFESAEAIFAGTGPGSAIQTRRGAIAHIQVLSQLEKNEAALALVDKIFGTTLDPELRQIRADLDAGKTLSFDTVSSARDGMAEVLYSVAGALNNEARDGDTLLFSRLSEYLRPGHVDTLLLSAQLLERLKQYDLASESYRRVPRDHSAFHAAELGRVQVLQESGKDDAAIEALEQLANSHGDLPIVHTALGDLLRKLEKFDAAIAAYDRALALYPEETPSQWFLYYVRGIGHERLGNWAKSEADFRKALVLDPGRPEVLNYLGYSLVEHNTKLDEALGMIERAVAARPDSGFIVDSLGWVLYRLGRYDEAVTHMERATELMPVDPVVNDHLGDVYWAVGRQLEAQFQWKRALSFVDYEDESNEADPDRIRQKIEIGLDQVLANEGAAPLKIAGEDG